MNARDRLAAGATVALADEHGAPVLIMAAADRISAAGLECLDAVSAGPAVVVRTGASGAGTAAPPDGPLAGLELELPVDAAGMPAGWSLSGRARTMRAVAAGAPLDVPGHVLTATVAPGDGPPQAAAWLADQVGSTAVVLAAPTPLPGRSAVTVSLAAIAAERASIEAVAARLPTPLGDLRIAAHDGRLIALIHGDPAASERTTVRHHRACLLGDALGSRTCDCRVRLDAALRAVRSTPAGVLLYSRAPGSPFESDHGSAVVDGRSAAGLLQRAGVRAAVVTPGDGALALGLAAHGIEVHVDVRA